MWYFSYPKILIFNSIALICARSRENFWRDEMAAVYRKKGKAHV